MHVLALAYYCQLNQKFRPLNHKKLKIPKNLLPHKELQTFFSPNNIQILHNISSVKISKYSNLLQVSIISKLRLFTGSLSRVCHLEYAAASSNSFHFADLFFLEEKGENPRKQPFFFLQYYIHKTSEFR